MTQQLWQSIDDVFSNAEGIALHGRKERHAADVDRDAQGAGLFAGDIRHATLKLTIPSSPIVESETPKPSGPQVTTGVSTPGKLCALLLVAGSDPVTDAHKPLK